MKIWNKCDKCGRFISYKDFESGRASRHVVSVDTEFTSEEFFNECYQCTKVKFDQYGNPLDRDGFMIDQLYCSFPDCGCDGARLCMAKHGPNRCCSALNIERGSMKYD